MGQSLKNVEIFQLGEYFSEYTFPFIVLNNDNIIIDVNDVFVHKLHYSKEELCGKKKITDISIAASANNFGIIKSSQFLNKNETGISDYIVLKSKKGKLKHFFFSVSKAGKSKKIVFLFEFFNQLKITEKKNENYSDKCFADAFPEITVFFDNRFVITDINTTSEINLVALFNLGPGKTIQDSIAPVALKKLSVDALKYCRKTGKKAEFEYGLSINDEFRTYRFRVFAYTTFIVALISDITSEKKKLEIIINSQKQLQEMLDEMPIAIVMTDSKGNIVFRNSPFDVLIKRAGESNTDNILNIVCHDTFNVLTNGNKNQKSYCVQLGKLYVDVSCRPDNNQKDDHYIFSFVDVTDREITKATLESNYRKHRVLVETSPNGILIRDFEKLYYANPEALRILGFKKSSDVCLDKVLKKSDLKSINARLKEVLNGGDVDFMEYTITPADTGKPISIVTRPILIDYEGKQVFQIVFRNNSAEKLLMEERVKKQMLEVHNKKLKAEIARRIEIEGKLNKTIDENKVLINEVHHRVKNNYQIISSMLNRCTKNISDPASIKAIGGVRDRLVSMAIVNDFYMDAENFNSILLVEYLKKIYQNFIRENGAVSAVSKINFTTKLRDVVVDLNDAVPIGLIFNEILTILFQLIDKLSDNFCNFVSLKWQNTNNLMFTIRFHNNVVELLKEKFDSSVEKVSLSDLLEQVDGYIENHFDQSELRLIVKLSKIN